MEDRADAEGLVSAMADRRLEYGLLGPLEMTVDGELMPLGTPKQRAVLAVLAMNRNSPVGVERLITAVWEGQSPSGARAGIHSYVSNIRKILNGVGVDARVVLAAAPPGYRLSVAESACDLGRFIAEKTAGVHAAASCQFEQASRHLRAALAEMAGAGARGPARLPVRRQLRHLPRRGRSFSFTPRCPSPRSPAAARLS